MKSCFNLGFNYQEEDFWHELRFLKFFFEKNEMSKEKLLSQVQKKIDTNTEKERMMKIITLIATNYEILSFKMNFERVLLSNECSFLL